MSQMNNKTLLIGAGITSAFLLSSWLCMAYWPEDYTPSLLHLIYLNSIYSSSDVKTIEQLSKYRQAGKVLTEEVVLLEKRLQELQQSGSVEVTKAGIALKKELLEYSNDIDHIFAKLDALPIDSVDVRQRRKQIIDWFAKDTKRIDDMLSHLKHIAL